eukprot:354031-Chlamydomonas_euryale.AAC.1
MRAPPLITVPPDTALPRKHSGPYLRPRIPTRSARALVSTHLHRVLPDTRIAVDHGVPKRDAKLRQQVVERWHVGAARGGAPPGACVVVEEAHPNHRIDVIPLGEHDEAEAAAAHVVPNLLNLLRVHEGRRRQARALC